MGEPQDSGEDQGAVPPPSPVIHTFTQISSEIDGRKRVRRWTARTGCGLDLVIERSAPENVPLTTIGLTAWFSEITCGPCLLRNRRKDTLE